MDFPTEPRLASHAKLGLFGGLELPLPVEENFKFPRVISETVLPENHSDYLETRKKTVLREEKAEQVSEQAPRKNCEPVNYLRTNARTLHKCSKAAVVARNEAYNPINRLEHAKWTCTRDFRTSGPAHFGNLFQMLHHDRGSGLAPPFALRASEEPEGSFARNYIPLLQSQKYLADVYLKDTLQRTRINLVNNLLIPASFQGKPCLLYPSGACMNNLTLSEICPDGRGNDALQEVSECVLGGPELTSLDVRGSGLGLCTHFNSASVLHCGFNDINVLDTLTFRARLVHGALNPVLMNEATFLTKDSKIHVWDLKRSIPVTQVEMHATKDSGPYLPVWSRIAYGLHPKQLYFAHTNHVLTCDTRSNAVAMVQDMQKHELSGFCTLKNRLQYCAVTQSAISIYDSRYTKTSLLQYKHSAFQHPPSKLVPINDGLLAYQPESGIIHRYAFEGNESRFSSLAPMQILDSFENESHDLLSFTTRTTAMAVRARASVESFMSAPPILLAGVALVPKSQCEFGEDVPAASLMVLSGNGNIFSRCLHYGRAPPEGDLEVLFTEDARIPLREDSIKAHRVVDAELLFEFACSEENKFCFEGNDSNSASKPPLSLDGISALARSMAVCLLLCGRVTSQANLVEFLEFPRTLREMQVLFCALNYEATMRDVFLGLESVRSQGQVRFDAHIIDAGSRWIRAFATTSNQSFKEFGLCECWKRLNDLGGNHCVADVVENESLICDLRFCALGSSVIYTTCDVIDCEMDSREMVTIEEDEAADLTLNIRELQSYMENDDGEDGGDNGAEDETEDYWEPPENVVGALSQRWFEMEATRL